MNKYVEIIKLLERIFGKSAVSKSLGTRTNVVRFPKGKQPLDPTTRHFDVEATAEKNPDLVNTIKNSIEDRMGDLTKMNDQELLTYKQNLQRLADHVNPPPAPMAEVIEAGSKQRVTGEGLEKLIEEAGQTARPGTLMGNLESRINKLKALSKEGTKVEDVLKDFAEGQKGMARLQDEGLVRATARQILINDIKSGKIKNMTVEEAINIKEPIEPFRTIYGEGALEQLDSLIPELRSLRTETEAEKLARSKFEFEPKLDRPKESYTKEELEDIFKKMKDEPENKADGGSIGLDYLMGIDNRPKYAGGGDVKKILDLIAKVNKELKGKKSMQVVNPKTGEITSPKKPITTAEKIKRKPTKEEYEEYSQILDDGENFVVQGNETFEELDALVKKQKDYEDYMFMQYKRGKLDPVAGEGTRDRMNFLRKKSEEAGMVGDRRLFTFDEMRELENLERKFSPMGIAKNEINEAEMIKQKYGKIIDDDLLQKILVDDNPQRKAEVMATIDEALKMREKGMSQQEIMDIIKNTSRTKQADGGPIGLNYLLGL